MNLLVSALEHSANLHLGEVVKYLGEETRLTGIFDESLGNPIVDLRSLAVMGFADAIGKMPFFLRLAKQMVDLAAEADRVLLMDSSGFNLPLAKKIRKRHPDKEIFYYILPQAWAWKRGRIPVLSRTCDRLLSILPFEKRHYPPGAPIEYVGHPLLDEIPRFKENPGDEIRRVAFMPGSRRGEIRALMPLYREVRKKIDAEALLVVPPYFSGEKIDALYGKTDGFRIVHDAHKTLLESDFAFICSGTATLEAALIGTPLILSYIARPLDYLLIKNLIKIEYAGLANLFSLDFQGRPMHPELLQHEVTVGRLLEHFRTFDRSGFLEDSRKLRDYLGHGSAEKTAKILLNG